MIAALFFSTFLFIGSQSFQPQPRLSVVAYRRRDASLRRPASGTAKAKKDPTVNDTRGYASPWDKMYDMLLLYKDREGNCNVPQNRKEDGVNLGTWLDTQRRLAKKDKLVSDRRRRLEEAGVVWDMDSWRWNQMYDLLLLYKAREGHCDVPYHHQEEGVKLGFWLNNQRHALKIIPERLRRLGEAGVVWDMDSWRWNQMDCLLLRYKAREGHCDVPQLHQEEGVNLGRWLPNQRQAMKVGKLDKNRQEQLEAAGVSFVPFEQRWDSMYSLLLDFKEREGHCDVPQNHQGDGTNLGTWLMTQRRALKLGKLDKNRQEQLEAAGVSIEVGLNVLFALGFQGERRSF